MKYVHSVRSKSGDDSAPRLCDEMPAAMKKNPVFLFSDVD